MTTTQNKNKSTGLSAEEISRLQQFREQNKKGKKPEAWRENVEDVDPWPHLNHDFVLKSPSSQGDNATIHIPDETGEETICTISLSNSRYTAINTRVVRERNQNNGVYEWCNYCKKELYDRNR